MPAQAEKCERFRQLHHGGEAFIVPNPWDVGTARILQGKGFKALATTSVGLAYTFGLADGEVPLDLVLDFCTRLTSVTDIPVTVDFEDGFARSPEGVARNIRRLAETGVAGCSIEDYDSRSATLYDFSHALERMQAAVEAVKALGMPFQLTARAENLFRGVNDMDDTIKRLQAFEAAGADVLYAPALTSLAQLREITSAIKAPFNVLAPFVKGATVRELHEHGATRISLGGALNWHAVHALMNAADEMLEQGSFGWTRDTTSKQQVRKLFDAG